MILHYDIQRLQRALDNFSYLTGVGITLLQDNFEPFGIQPKIYNRCCKAIMSSAKGYEQCQRSDRKLLEECKKTGKPTSHICHAGFVDMVIPIIHNDAVIGYAILGQMKDNNIPFSEIAEKIKNYPLDLVETEHYYNKIPSHNTETVDSMLNITTILVKYILLENMLKPDYNQNVETVTTYISQNLEHPLTVQGISKATHLSKSALYKLFHSNFNCTVSDYIAKMRVEKSLELLVNTDLSIEQISIKTGFASIAYYSKTFKKLKGMSPRAYRKLNK